MTQVVPATAQLGPGKTGLAIGYRVLDIARVQYSAFTTTNVAETGTAGTYSISGGVVAPNAGGYIVWGVSGTDYVEATVDSDVINSVSGSVGGNVEGKVLGGGAGVFVGDGAQVAASGGTGLTAQQTADAVNNLAPAGASGATGSIRAELDAIRLITDAIDTSAVTVTASNDAGVLTIIQAVTFGATVSRLTISGTWAKVWWSLKENIYDDDSESIIQLVATNPAAALTDGLLYLDGAAIVAPITHADGVLTVNQAGGIVTIWVSDNATVLLAAASELVWDVKTKDAAGNTVQNTTGTASIVRAVTQTI